MKKILLIEDDHDIADLVEMVLADQYEVLTHRNSTQIMQVITEFVPDLMLIDNAIGMKYAPEILTEIKSSGNYNGFPYILFSASDDIKKIAGEIGAVTYLAKPFDLDQLFSCIEGVLDSAYPTRS